MFYAATPEILDSNCADVIRAEQSGTSDTVIDRLTVGRPLELRLWVKACDSCSN